MYIVTGPTSEEIRLVTPHKVDVVDNLVRYANDGQPIELRHVGKGRSLALTSHGTYIIHKVERDTWIK
jgi:hypothetical protein